MKSVEAGGKNVQEARRAAAELLGVAEDQLEFEVVSKPGTLAGLFGGGECRVRATLIEPGDVIEDHDDVEAVSDEPVADSADECCARCDTEAGDARPRSDDDVAELVRCRAIEFVEHVVAEIGVENVSVATESTDEGEIKLNISGDNLGLIIGRRGETLDALQLIAAIAANRALDDGARIILDAENYRERHREMLREMALEYAADVKERGQEAVIPDLKAYERRIVHMVLRDDPGVETYSEGDGRDRVLVISPKDQ